MKILYRGSFLGEGFQRLGHEVTPFDLREDVSFRHQIEAACSRPDLVFLEFMADTCLPQDIAECDLPLAAYFIDSPINAFWQAPLSRLFDFAFVDQLSSVAAFRDRKARVEWLPLCVPSAAFREPAPKEHFLTFVGTVNNLRLKRKNLLHYLSEHVPVTLRSGLPSNAMLDLFSRSSVVLNENLFDGLTLRVLQGLASGSLVLTEAPSTGSERYFKDGTHLACYTPESLLETVNGIRNNPEKWSDVARNGQEECRKNHTSEKRAAEVFTFLERNSRSCPARLVGGEAQLVEAEAAYLLRLRFGGSYRRSYALFRKYSHAPEKELSAKACCLLAGAMARRGAVSQAGALLEENASRDLSERGCLLLAMILIRQQQPEKALRLLQTSLPLFRGRFSKLFPALEALAAADKDKAFISDLILLIAQAYYLMGRVIDLGFAKTIQDDYPENAFTSAIIAWNVSPSPAILDFLILCGREHKVAGELLPYLLEAIQRGAATDEQIAFAAETADAYYDKKLSRTITRELHDSIKRSMGIKP